MVDLAPLNSFISSRQISGIPSQFLFGASAIDSSILFYQPNEAWRSTVDPYSMIVNKGVKANLSYTYGTSTFFAPTPISPYQFTGFLAPISRSYRVKVLAYPSDLFGLGAALQSQYDFGTGNVLRLVADIQPFIKIAQYGSDTDYYYKAQQDFSILDYRKGLIFTYATGIINANLIIPNINYSTAAYEIEINLNAGDFVCFGVAVVPQLSPFKLNTTAFSGDTRTTIQIQASITQVSD